MAKSGCPEDLAFVPDSIGVCAPGAAMFLSAQPLAPIVRHETHRQPTWRENYLCAAGEGNGLGPCCGCCASDAP